MPPRCSHCAPPGPAQQDAPSAGACARARIRRSAVGAAAAGVRETARAGPGRARAANGAFADIPFCGHVTCTLHHPTPYPCPRRGIWRGLAADVVALVTTKVANRKGRSVVHLDLRAHSVTQTRPERRPHTAFGEQAESANIGPNTSGSPTSPTSGRHAICWANRGGERDLFGSEHARSRRGCLDASRRTAP